MKYELQRKEKEGSFGASLCFSALGWWWENEDKVVPIVLLLQSSFLKVQASNCLLSGDIFFLLLVTLRVHLCKEVHVL